MRHVESEVGHVTGEAWEGTRGAEADVSVSQWEAPGDRAQRLRFREPGPEKPRKPKAPF